VDQFLENAIEVDVDALSDGSDVLICGVMEHVEYAGIHSGDSACVLPPHSLTKVMIEQIKTKTYEIAKALNVVGLMNIQWAVQGKELFMIEVNPRASRTIPFVSKATGVPWAKMGALVMAGKTIKELKLKEITLKHFSVKEVVLPFNKFLGQDIVLGPEMRSTGEVMGHDENLGCAFAKSILAAGEKLPVSGTAFVSCNDRDKNQKLVAVAEKLKALGFKIVATGGTADFLEKNKLVVEDVLKVRQGSPNIIDEIINGRIDLVINTPRGKGPVTDDYYIRQAALKKKVYTATTIAGAQGLVLAIEALKKDKLKIKALQDY
jgi:carbamoyl-phosphate synthase large subunit